MCESSSRKALDNELQFPRSRPRIHRCNGVSCKRTDDDAYFLKTIGLAESTDEIYCDIHERTASRIHAVTLQWWACLVHVPVDQACWASFDVFLDKLLQLVDLAVLELFVNAQVAL